MRLMISLLLLASGFLTSCTSEYEERLKEGRTLKEQLNLVEETCAQRDDENLVIQMNELKKEIDYLAKVSGHEDLYLQEIYGN